MKYVGLIKWFDDSKGFGRIGTPDDGDIFLHQNNLAVRPEKLLKATSLIFEIKKDNRGASAINAQPPSSYEDFKLILSFCKRNPTITAEKIVTAENRFGNTYKRNETKSYSIVDYSLHQLLRKKQAKEIFEFFKKYFDEQNHKEDFEFVTKFLLLTKKQIKGVSLELDDYLLQEFESKRATKKDRETLALPLLEGRPYNDFLIQKLIAYFLEKANPEFLFEVWKNKTHLIDSSSVGLLKDSSNEETFFEFPSEIFLKNQTKISSYDLSRILNQSNGNEIVTEIVDKKISNLESISHFQYAIDEILKSIQVLSRTDAVNNLRELFTNKLLELLRKCDFTKAKNETITTFKFFLEIIKNKSNNLNFDTTIQKFNESISGEEKFILWQATRYFEPEKTFFDNHLSQLSFSDFLNAPNEFHIEYFSNNLNKIGEFETIENFCLLSFLIIETPYKTIRDIFPKLLLKYQATYWLNFPRGDGYWGKYYQENYEAPDIPFDLSNFIVYLDSVIDLNDLLIASELTRKIQEIYSSKTRNHSNNEGFFKLSELERKRIIQELIPQAKIFSNEKLVELFKATLNKSTNKDTVSLCKTFIPKFINENILCLDELINIIRNTETDTKHRQEIFSHISERTSKLERVSLWYKGYIKSIDFHEAIEVFEKFQVSQQPNLLRKLFSLIQRNKINNFENCLAQLLLLATNTKLNLDVRICLAVINSLKTQQNYIGENNLSDIVCQYVNENVEELVQFHDLLQKCRGRTWRTAGDAAKNSWFLNVEGGEFNVVNNTVAVNDSNYPFDKEKRTVEIEGETYSFRWVKKEDIFFELLYDKPLGVTFCDAAKPQKDETLGSNFYWCCNAKCYSPCQDDHIHLEWSEYSLRDFIKIMKLPFEEDKYYRFVSVVNRANRLMKKLVCTSCNHLLRDTRTSKFAFYRVTTFHCTNSECSQLHEVVYLNHCLNWKCLNVVDSRISKRCPNGLVICDSCGDCCSHKMLETRINNLKTNGAFNSNNSQHQKLQHLVDNNFGHLERGEKFNYKTGERISD